VNIFSDRASRRVGSPLTPKGGINVGTVKKSYKLKVKMSSSNLIYKQIKEDRHMMFFVVKY